jgi:hypothetical protein
MFPFEDITGGSGRRAETKKAGSHAGSWCERSATPGNCTAQRPVKDVDIRTDLFLIPSWARILIFIANLTQYSSGTIHIAIYLSVNNVGSKKKVFFLSVLEKQA